MGCCVPNVEQISLSFEVVLLRLEPKEQSNTFLIREITKDTFEKEDGMTFIDCCLSSNDQTLSKMFTNKKIGEETLYYCYLRKIPVIKTYKAMKEFKPISFGQLTKIIILSTEEALKQNISNALIKKQTKKIAEMIGTIVDFTKIKEQMEKALDPNITKDSLRLTDTEDKGEGEEEEENEPAENELFIEGVLNAKVLREVKATLFPNKIRKSERGKEETGQSTGIDLKKKEDDIIDIDELDNPDAENKIINKVVIRNAKFPQLEVFTKLIKTISQFKGLKKFGFTNNFIDGEFEGWETIIDFLINHYNIRWLDFHSSTIYDSHLPDMFKALKDKRIRYLDLSENFLSFHGTETIAKWLKTNKTLQRLYLQRNAVCQFKAEGVKNICEALKTSINIQILDFSFMDLTTCGVHIAELLKVSKSLKEVNVHCAKLNYGDFKAICRTLAQDNTTLETLDIGMNDMGGNKSLEEIANMLKTNKSLTAINLDQIGLTMDNYSIILDGIEANKTIEKFYFSFNSEVKPKIILNFFMKREGLKFLEYVPYNTELDKDRDKALTLEEKKIIEKFSSSRPEVTLKTT